MPESMITIQGLEETLSNLAVQVQAIQGRTLKGFIKAATVIYRDSVRNSPRLTGNLANSHVIIIAKGPTKPEPTFKGEGAEKTKNSYASMVVESVGDVTRDKLQGQDSVIVGVGAYYAIFVHEKHKERPKFLQRAINDNVDIILRHIKNEAWNP